MKSSNLLYRILLVVGLTVTAVVCLIPTLVTDLPDTWKGILPDRRVHLGLDLQRGTHLVLTVDVAKAVESALERNLDDIKREATDAKVGVGSGERRGTVARRAGAPPTFSERYVGDAMLVSNIDSEYALRVFEAWFDWGFEAHGAGSVRVGLYDLNSEFDTTESRGLFINSAYGIGQELAQTGRNGPSIFPVSALAARLAWAPAEPWLIEFAVVDGVPGDPGGTHRSRWHLSR